MHKCSFCEKDVPFIIDDRSPKDILHGRDDGMISYISGRCQDINGTKAKKWKKDRSARSIELYDKDIYA